MTTMSDSDFKKIDDVSDLVKRLYAGDDCALKDAENFISHEKNYKTAVGVDRTQINNFDSSMSSTDSGISQESFLKAMEIDAKERASRKARNRLAADEYKSKGNDFFKACNYTKAIECYTDGIAVAKDYDLLYTNRANCYLKVKEYNKALLDCESASFLSNKKNLKALHFQGKALIGLKRYEEAKVVFFDMKFADSKLEKLALECVSEAEAAQHSDAEEAAALRAFKEGDSESGVMHLLDKLHRKDEPHMYYSGGFRVLADSLVSAEACILFRSKGGFELLANHGVIGDTLTCPLVHLQNERRDLLLAVIEVLCRVVEDNEENQRRCFQVPGLMQRLGECLDLKCRAARNQLRQQALRLLFCLSRTSSGRRGVLSVLDPVHVVPKLFVCIQQGAEKSAQHAASLLNNLALSERFQSSLRGTMDAALLPSVEKLLSEGCANLSVLPSCINCVMNLCHDVHIRRRLAARPTFLSACAAALERNATVHEEIAHEEILLSLLGVLVNVTLEQSESIKNVSTRLTRIVLDILRDHHSTALRERTLSLLGHVVPRCESAAKIVAESTFLVPLLFKILQSEEHPCVPAALKILTACLQCHDHCRYSVGDDFARLESLLLLLKNFNAPAAIVANAALCLAATLQDTAASELLATTDIMRNLLMLVREQSVREAKVNCAILAGKLAQCDPRHRERLHQLDGFQILDKVMASTAFR